MKMFWRGRGWIYFFFFSNSFFHKIFWTIFSSFLSSFLFFLCFFLFSMFTLLLCERTTKNESCKFICQVCGYAKKFFFLFFPFFVFVSSTDTFWIRNIYNFFQLSFLFPTLFFLFFLTKGTKNFYLNNRCVFLWI